MTINLKESNYATQRELSRVSAKATAGEASLHGQRYMQLGTEFGCHVYPAQFPADGD